MTAVPVKTTKFLLSTFVALTNLSKNDENLRLRLRKFVDLCKAMESCLISRASMVDRKLATAVENYLDDFDRNKNAEEGHLKELTSAFATYKSRQHSQDQQEAHGLWKTMEAFAISLRTAKKKVSAELGKLRTAKKKASAKSENMASSGGTQLEETVSAESENMASSFGTQVEETVSAEVENLASSFGTQVEGSGTAPDVGERPQKSRMKKLQKIFAKTAAKVTRKGWNQIASGPLLKMVKIHEGDLENLEKRFIDMFNLAKESAKPPMPKMGEDALNFWYSCLADVRKAEWNVFFDNYRRYLENEKSRQLTKKEKALLEKVLAHDGVVKVQTFADVANKYGFPFNDEFVKRESMETFYRLVGIDPADMFKSEAREYVPHTREWLFERIRKRYASEGAENSIFVLLGKAGSGKTTALAKLCRDGGANCGSKEEEGKEAQAGKVFVAAMHRFVHNNAKTHEISGVIKSLSFQLENSIESFNVDRKQSREQNVQNDLSQLFRVFIKNPAKDVKAEDERTAVIVIDALDECKEQSRLELLRLILAQWKALDFPKWLKLLVSARDLREIPTQLDEFRPTYLNSDEPGNEEDLLKCFDSWLQEKKLPTGDMVRAKDLLLRNSEGLFLYFRFLRLMNFDCEQDGGLQLSTLEKRAPTTVGGFYVDYFQRKLTDFNGDRDRYNRVLGPLVCTRKPLPLEVWMDVCNYSPADEDDCRRFKTEIVGAVQDVVDETKKDGTYSLIHKSMTDFLSEELDKKSKQAELVVSKKKCHHQLAKWCLAESNREKDFSLENVLYHLVQAGRPEKDFDALLCNYNWLASAVDHLVNCSNELKPLWLDVEKCNDLSRESRMVVEALRLSAHALRDVDWRQLPAQLYQRLDPSHPLITRCLEERDGYVGLWPAADPTKYLVPADSATITKLQGHKDRVTRLCFSPDGTRVASASKDKTVRIWCVEDGMCMHELKEHSDVVLHVCFSPDGTKVASAAEDNTVCIWDVQTGKRLHPDPLQHDRYVDFVCFTPQGDKVISSSQDRTIHIWSVESGKRLHHLLKGYRPVCVSPDGTKVLGALHEVLRIWSVDEGELLQTLEGHTDNVRSACFSADGAMIVSGSDDNTARVWSVENGEELHKEPLVHNDCVRHVCFSKDGTKVGSASDENTVRLWSVEEGNQLGPSKQHTAGIISLHFSSDGAKLYSVSNDATLTIWRVRGRKPISRFTLGTNSLRRVCFSPDGTKVVSSSNDYTIRLSIIREGNAVESPPGHTKQVNSLILSQDGTMVVSASDDNTVGIWSVEGGELMTRLTGHKHHVKHACFSQDGTTVASASRDNTARLWNVSDGGQTHVLKGHTREVNSVCFSPDGSKVVSASNDNTARLWSVKDGEHLRTLAKHIGWVLRACFSEDGKLIGTASYSKVYVWKVDEDVPPRLEDIPNVISEVELCRRGLVDDFFSHSPEKFRVESEDHCKLLHLLQGHAGVINRLCFAQDGARSAFVTADNRLCLWDTKEKRFNEKKISRSSKHTYAVCISPDGSQIITASIDNSLRLWLEDDGEISHSLHGDSCRLKSVCFTPDDTTIVAASQDGSVFLEDLEEAEPDIDTKTKVHRGQYASNLS